MRIIISCFEKNRSNRLCSNDKHEPGSFLESGFFILRKMEMTQNMKAYSPEDLKVWTTLFQRQKQNLKGKVCSEYDEALEDMREVLNEHEIPEFEKINQWFAGRTGWRIKVVPGLIPVEDFFALLAEKQFCSSTWLRSMEQLDYLEEPDMFHDTFGHIPLLANPVFSDFMQAFGELGCTMLHDQDVVLQLQRLYWYTIEFGMIQPESPKIYGAGIISSFGETNRAVSKEVAKIPFQMEEVLNKLFKTDEVQEEYVCIDSFETLFASFVKLKNQQLCQIGL